MAGFRFQIDRETLAGYARDVFHIATWLPGYGGGDLRADVVAGLTVGVMLIPQGMAYAMLAGVPPIYGLYASLVPLLVYPLFGTSRHLAVGTIAIDMLIISAGLSALAEPGSARYVELAVFLALLVGLIQLAMGIGRLGFVVNLLSRPVIAGFTSAAALIIGFSQLGNLLGLDLPQTQQVFVLVSAAAARAGEVQLVPLVLGLGGVVLMVVVRRWPSVPGPLTLVAAGTLAVWGLGLAGHGVDVVGGIPHGLPVPASPYVDLPTVRELLPTAGTLALVQFMSVISLGKVFGARHQYTVDANRELVAVGAANALGSFFRSIPISGSFSRTAVNDRAGAHSAMANVMAAAVIGLTLLFLTPLFYYLPVPVLAAIIMVAAFGLLDLKEIRYLLRTKRTDGGIALLTFAVTLLVGIQEGILTGIGASVVGVMYRISRPNVAVLGHLPGTRSFRDVTRHEESEPVEGILMLRVDASFSFANADFLRDLILEHSRASAPPVRAVVIDASSINDLDTTAVAVLLSVAETLEARGVGLYFGGVKEPVYDTLVQSGLYDALGPDSFHLSPHRAVKHILEAWGRSEDYLVTVPEGSNPVEGEPGWPERPAAET